MTTPAPALDQPTLTITEEILVRASMERTFDALLAQLGRLNETPDGKPLAMILDARPGGRWYRDLGGDNGHQQQPDLPAVRSGRRHVDRVQAHARRSRSG